jgi:hypothetical protein
MRLRRLVMKRLMSIALALFALLLTSGLLAPAGGAKTTAKEKAVVEFPEKVKLLGVFLKGEYVFVHDEEAMARGEACTYIYTSVKGEPGILVASFHCVPLERKKVERFTVALTRLLPDLLELREYQFAGSTHGHGVPRSDHRHKG